MSPFLYASIIIILTLYTIASAIAVCYFVLILLELIDGLIDRVRERFK